MTESRNERVERAAGIRDDESPEEKRSAAARRAWDKYKRGHDGYEYFRQLDREDGFCVGYAKALADIEAQTVTQVPNDAVWRDGRWVTP